MAVQGTVTYIDGPVIGLNTDGSKDTEGRLKTTHKVKTDKAKTKVDIDGITLNHRVADILPGDTVACSGANDAIHTIRVTRPPAVQAKKDQGGFGPV